MAMILLLLAAMIAGPVMSQAPPYLMYSSELGQAFRTLAVNIISMEDRIPLLNDPRRQYTEIIHVILTHGILRSGCVVDDYYKEYYLFLNNSLPDAICHTAEAIGKIRNLLDEIHNSTKELLQLTASCTLDNCDEIIDTIIKDEPGKYCFQVQILTAAGEVAIQLNAMHLKFLQVSRDLRASQYLLQSPAELENIVNAISMLHRTIHPFYC